MEPADTWHAFGVLKGRRLVGSAGLFLGIEIPEELTDAPLDDLPYVDLFYRFMGDGYTLKRGLGQRPREAAQAPEALSV
jgi:hypothetical protein